MQTRKTKFQRTWKGGFKSSAERLQERNVEAAGLLGAVGVVGLQPLPPPRQVGQLEAGH